MNQFSHNKVLRGTFGRVWLDGDRLSNVKSFEAKATINYEELNVNNDFGTKRRYMGYSISGTMTLHKFDSHILRKYQAAIMSGELPEMKIVASLNDPQSYGAERVALYDVTLDEITLSKFENQTILEEEVPFAAGSFEFLDLID